MNILNLSGNVWIRHVSAGEEPMIHGQEGHNRNLQALGLCGEGDMVNQSRERKTFSAKMVSAKPPGFTLSESVMVGRIS